MPGALDVAQLATIRARIPGKVVLVNTAGASVADEQAAGVDVAIYHGLCLQAAQHAIEQPCGRSRNNAIFVHLMDRSRPAPRSTHLPVTKTSIGAPLNIA